MSEFLNVALPKGRLGERVYKMFAEAGFPCDELLDPKRKLIFENPEAATAGSSPRTALGMWSAAPPTWAWPAKIFCWNTARTSMSCWT